MKKEILLFFCAIPMLLSSRAVFAAPAITDVTGVIDDGASVTVSGSGFGAGSTIVSWDNFEGHATGATLIGGGLSPIVGYGWTTQQNPTAGADNIEISTSRAHGGSKSVYINWSTNTINAFGWAGKGPYNELYITWWGYQYLGGSTTNRKWYYLFGDSGDDTPQGMPLMPAGSSTWGYYNNDSTSQPGTTSYSGTNNMSTDGVYGLSGITWSSTNSVWNRWEYYQKLNTSSSCTVGNNCDGIITYWVDAVKRYHRTDYKHRFVNNQWDDFRLGHMWQGSGTRQAWIDDVFIATSQARIEIGDDADFDSCTHREIQRHTSWDAEGTSIAVTVNQGGFADGATAYVFVVDSTGAVSAGRQITFGGGTPDATAPSAPQGLSVL